MRETLSDDRLRDAERIEQIRRAHRSARPKPTVNPSWANTHGDLGFVLDAYDAAQARIRDLEASLARIKRETLEKAAGLAWGNETPIPDKLPSDPRDAFMEGCGAAGQRIAEGIEAAIPAPDSGKDAIG